MKTENQILKPGAQNTMEGYLDKCAENLPPGWEILISVEKNSGSVVVIRPNGTEFNCEEKDTTMFERLKNATACIRDEIAHDEALRRENAQS